MTNVFYCDSRFRVKKKKATLINHSLFPVSQLVTQDKHIETGSYKGQENPRIQNKRMSRSMLNHVAVNKRDWGNFLSLINVLKRLKVR